MRKLKGFQCVALKPGESCHVSFVLTGEQSAFTRADGSKGIEPGTFQVWVSPDSTSGLQENFLIAIPGNSEADLPGAEMQINPRVKGIAIPVLLALVPLVVYGVILQLNLPTEFGHFFSSYSFPLVVLILIVFRLGFSFKGIWGGLISACLVMACFAIPLAYKWSSGYSDAALIAGTIPYKDGFYYLAGAESILTGHRILPGFYQAAWRPLFPGFLSSLMLLFGDNLRGLQSLLVALVGISAFLSAYLLRKSIGTLATVIYLTLLFLFFQNQTGYILSESLGMALGCLALILLWNAARTLNKIQLLAGASVLMIAVSVRAGAFFVFPFLVLWAGWVFRGERRFSYPIAGYVTLAIFGVFLFVNVLYSWLMVARGTSTFGNFSATLYGQVLGGVGWAQAVKEISAAGSTTPYQVIFDYFIKHPSGFLLGSLKAYRDYFLPGATGIFSFVSPKGQNWFDIILWTGCLLLLVIGLVQSLRRVRTPVYSLLLAFFIGILLSIPFLPPIDGGRRFYASTMPFFALIVAIGLLGSKGQIIERSREKRSLTNWYSNTLVGIVVLFTVFIPIPTLLINHSIKDLQQIPACPEGLSPFIISVGSGSYVDIVQDGKASCGSYPELCLSDFWNNGTERDIDDFFQKLYSIADGENPATRISPAYDLVGGGFHFFIGTPQQLTISNPEKPLSGCVQIINTATQSLYLVQSLMDVNNTTGE